LKAQNLWWQKESGGPVDSRIRKSKYKKCFK
jgi:hypothetical protein